MVPPKETAEEQLLHMIEGPSGPRRPSRRSAKTSAIHQLVGRLKDAGSGLKGRLLPSRRPKKDRGDAFLSRLQLINRVVVIALLGMGGYLVVDLVMLRPVSPTLDIRPVPYDGTAAGGIRTVGLGDPLRPLADYQQALRRRNPFRLASARVVNDATPVDTTVTQLDDLIGTLSVVGINRGRVPEALIEDLDAQRTHIVTVGQSVNGLKIESIDARGVLVSYEGESGYIP